MKLSVATLALAATAVADLHTLNSLKYLMNQTIEYHKAINAWDGSYVAGISLWRRSNALISDIKFAIAHPNATVHERTTPVNDAQLMEESFQVNHQLMDEIGAAVDAGIDKAHHYRSIPVFGRLIATNTFNKLKAATLELSKVYAPKGMEERPDETTDIMNKLDAHFDRAQRAFDEL